jgi:hypothetical protein
MPQAGYCPNLNYNFGVSAECLHKKPHRGDRTTVCDSLTLLVAAYGARAACEGFGFARNTATTLDVFYWLQVTNFDVLVLLNSAPNGPDYIDIWGLCLHVSFCFISRVSIMVCVIYRIGEYALGALFEKLTVSCP